MLNNMEKRLKYTIALVFLLVCGAVFPQAISVFYGLHIPDVGFSNHSLYLQFIGIDGYVATHMGQRIGWQGMILYSTAGPDQGVISDLSVGILVGQQLILGPVVAAINLAGGLGVSIGDIGSSAEHLSYYGEATVEAGALPVQGIQITAYFGIQTLGNVFPGWPGTEFLFYSPITGMKFTFSCPGQRAEPLFKTQAALLIIYPAARVRSAYRLPGKRSPPIWADSPAPHRPCPCPGFERRTGIRWRFHFCGPRLQPACKN
jgi:hypothetical protein